MQQEDIVNRFTYHPPFGNQAERYATIREWALNFALKINELTPASREQSLAITELENCVAHANAAIARNERQAEGSSSPDPNTLYPNVLTVDPHPKRPQKPRLNFNNQ